jgi:single-stranded-DNA-specific exonuclease
MTIRDVTSSYRVRATDPVAAAALASEVGVGAATAQVLLQRGLTGETAGAFLDPRLADLSDPSVMADRSAAADRLASACRKRERVALFGDYDVDGTTSAAILADALEKLGAEVQAHAANRFEGGYGLSDPALDRCLSGNPHLLITCDCGSADHPRIARARERGVDVIVVDHHLVPDEPLPANAFLNPHRPDCAFDYAGLCSAGLALSLVAGLRAALGAKLDVRQYLDLVALGTVADVAPLDGDNRALVRAGLRVLAAPRLRPGVQALRDRAGLRGGQRLGAGEIAFRLAPRLNAPGRLADAALTLALLRCRDREEAFRLAAQIEDVNDERKSVERAMTDEAIAQVEERWGREPEHGVVVASERFHRGVVGITAARLCDRFGVPAVVVALDGERGHGSGRTAGDIDLHAALSRCSNLFERFGGHRAAAGVTLMADRIEEFREAFAAEVPAPGAADRALEVDVELGGSFSMPTVQDLGRLEPMGHSNRAPLFAIPEAKVEDARVVGDGQHLKLRLRHGDAVFGAFGGRLAHRIDDLGKEVTAIGTLKPDLWRGGDHLELSIRALA